ncbi:DUF202 domain-containing protein [uncultured Ruegeria sp.]|uniref:DUF202 domain-containing protein n=1 Tax=uncultured Ruegeria sp. TaxID=259304 RepID=UPI002620F22B|nr:DUF202 domain-containing protein [uncultured Ruegeria sp.]
MNPKVSSVQNLTSDNDNQTKRRREIDNMVLSVVRTELANRRTLLAYVKTALGLAIAGLGLLHFYEAQSMQVGIGLLAFPVSGLVLVLGGLDYLRTKRLIEAEKRDSGVA